MYFKTILEVLHGDNLNAILSVINKSVYVADLIENNIEAIHTGVTFRTNKSTFELLYNPIKHLLIRQVRFFGSNYPSALGVEFYRADKYFTHYNTRRFIAGIDEKDECIKVYNLPEHLNHELLAPASGITIIDDLMNNVEYRLSNFVVFDSETRSDLKTFPLQREFEIQLFFNKHHRFEKFVSDAEFYSSNRVERDSFDSEHSSGRVERYEKYAGTWAQDIEDLSDDFIDGAFGGEPDAYWNID